MVDRPEWLESDLVAALDRVISRYQAALRDAISEAEGPDRLTMPQLRCLQAIVSPDSGPATVSGLAEQIRVSVPTMSSMIDGLVARGLVERSPDPTSRRRILVRVTDHGASLLARYQQIIDNRHHEIIRGLSEPEKRRLLSALGVLAERLEQMDRVAAGAGA